MPPQSPFAERYFLQLKPETFISAVDCFFNITWLYLVFHYLPSFYLYLRRIFAVDIIGRDRRASACSLHVIVTPVSGYIPWVECTPKPGVVARRKTCPSVKTRTVPSRSVRHMRAPFRVNSCSVSGKREDVRKNYCAPPKSRLFAAKLASFCLPSKAGSMMRHFQHIAVQIPRQPRVL